jgi:hypothetical protein
MHVRWTTDWAAAPELGEAAEAASVALSVKLSPSALERVAM